MIRKTLERRISRSDRKAEPRTPSLLELVRSLPPSYLAQKELDRRAAEAKKAAATPEATSATSAAEAVPSPAPLAEPAPPLVEGPPPEPPSPQVQYWEEKCRWRSRDVADWELDDDGVRYETIHEYDPMEWRENESDYDWDR